jgi:hypothetical protein
MPVPKKILAGVTVEFTVQPPADYGPAQGYDATMVLVNEANRIEVGTSLWGSDGSLFECTIPAATSALYAPGLYRYYIVAILSSDKRTVAEGEIEILPDVLSATAGIDTRSSARKILDAIEATILRTATDDQESISVDGVSIKRRSPEDLEKLASKYRRIVADEAARDSVATSGRNPNVIRVHFGRA